MWNRETVLRKLESHPHFSLLKEELDGKFACGYEIDGIAVLIFNCTDGVCDVWFGNVLTTNADIESAQQFARIAIEILNKKENETV